MRQYFEEAPALRLVPIGNKLVRVALVTRDWPVACMSTLSGSGCSRESFCAF